MYQYSFANVDLILEIPDSNGVYTNLKVTGFGAGENLINAVRRAPIATTQFGAYGHMVVSMQRIIAGDLTFPVLMNAPENELLQNYANYFQANADGDGEPIYPIHAKIVDNMGADSATMDNGVILAMPAMSRGQTLNTVTWIISFEKMKFERKLGKDHTELG